MPLPPSGHDQLRFGWRAQFDNNELNALHAECFDHPPGTTDWWSQLNRHSLGWICLRFSATLVGFINVAWDGGVHCFLLDTMVRSDFRRRGLARTLVSEAVRQTRLTGCEWLHVDFEPHQHSFYLDACGFKPTEAGLLRLK